MRDIAVMVVDDSLVIRGLISRMIKETPGLEVVASVADGAQAVKQIEKLEVDVVVLDIEMPVMDGLTALPKLLKARPNVKVIMASTLTGPNAEASMKALALGAADYIPKPSSSKDVSGVGGSDAFRHELISKVQGLGIAAKRASGKPIEDSHPVSVSARVSSGEPGKKLLYSGPVTLLAPKPLARRPRVLAVGSSTGGPQALMTFFSGLKKNIGLPILVTQHMPPKFTTMLAQHITAKTGFECVEAVDGMPLIAGQIALAPGDFHMEIVGMPGAAKVKLNQNAPENFCRPAVDPMMRSLVPVFGDRVLAVILTGMGSDGLKGGRVVVEAGGEMIAQDEASSVVWGMPGAVATAGICTQVLPLNDLPGYVTERIAKAMP